ncbi:phage integrase SAM-like domain-containing protein [Planctomycetota bacterium]
MASISKDPGGRKRILFVGPDKKRKAIRLGKIPQRAAEAIKVKVEALIGSSVSGCGWDNETARWVAEIPDNLAGKLAAVGLIPKRASAGADTLGPFLDSYIKSRNIRKSNTQRNYDRSRKNVTDFFGEERDLRDITPGDADDWRQWLISRYSDATVSREVKRARQFFRAADRTSWLAVE